MKLFLLSTILFYFHQSLSAQIDLNKGLIAYYPFNGNANDISGHNNNPVFNNTTFVTGKNGNEKSACYFNGKDSYIQIKNSPSLCPEEMTIVAVIKPMGFYHGLCYNNSILDKGTWDYRPGSYALRFTAGEYTKGDCYDGDSLHQNFVGIASSSAGKTSQDIYVQPGTWYSIIFTVNKEYGRLYIDGEMISSFKTTAKIGKNKEDLFLGKKDNPQYPYWFNGVIDEIRIYSKALSFEEVTELYAQLNQQ